MRSFWKQINNLSYNNHATGRTLPGLTTLTSTSSRFTLEIEWSEMFDQPLIRNGMFTVRQPLLDGTTDCRHTMINARDIVFFDFIQERK